MSTQERMERAVTAAKAAAHELEFGRLDHARDMLEEALKQVYALKKNDSHPLLNLTGQGR